MAEKNDNRKLATTRLLDLLRSQQAGAVEVEEKQSAAKSEEAESRTRKSQQKPPESTPETPEVKSDTSTPEETGQSPKKPVKPSTLTTEYVIEEPASPETPDAPAEPPAEPPAEGSDPAAQEQPGTTVEPADDSQKTPVPEQPKFSPSSETQNKLRDLLARMEDKGKASPAESESESVAATQNKEPAVPDSQSAPEVPGETQGSDDKPPSERGKPSDEDGLPAGDELIGTQPLGDYLGKSDTGESEPDSGDTEVPSEPEAEPEAQEGKRRSARNLLDRRKRFIDAEKSDKATEVIKAQLAEEAKEKSTSTEIEVDEDGWALPLGASPELFEMAESLAPSLQADQFSANLMRRITKSNRRLCLEITDKGIRFLQARLGGASIRVERFGYLKVPYKLDETTVIRDVRTLTEVALPKVVGKKELKKLYTSVYSQQFEGRTHFFLVPSSLGRKDLSELVNWQATKNLNLGDGRGILRYGIYPSQTAGGKDHVILVGADKEKTKQSISAFRKAGIQVRYTSQLPVLLGNSFKKEYPDFTERTTILLHMQQSQTTLVVVYKGVLLTTREIAVGVEDFEAALEQKVNIDGKSVTLTRQESGKILTDFGVPRRSAGKIKPHGLTLYRVSIFLRPVIERLTSEIQRSINFFKKQYSELAWDHIFISGQGGTIPNLSAALQENLGIDISLFNPLRAENVVYADEEKTIPYEDLPLYTTLFALLNVPGNDEYNLLPDPVVRDQTLIPFATVAGYAALVLVPLLLLSVVLEQMRADALVEELARKEAPLRNMSPKTEQYLGFQNDIRILTQYKDFLKTDSLKAQNYLKVMKYLSRVVPEEIRLTGLTIDRELIGGKTQTDAAAGGTVAPVSAFRDYAHVVGFVESDPSVADIRLTNFRMNMEKSRAFSKISLSVKPRDKNVPNRLFFEMDCEF